MVWYRNLFLGKMSKLKRIKLAAERLSIAVTKKDAANFPKGKSSKQLHPGIPVLVVDEEIYHRPPTMMIATVDKFAMMAWRGQVRTLLAELKKNVSGTVYSGLGPIALETTKHSKDNLQLK